VNSYVVYDSRVKHNRLFGKLKHENLLEGMKNQAYGRVLFDYFFLEFFNSFGVKSFIEGKLFRLGPFAFLLGKAHGYSNFPKGRFAVAVGFFSKNYFRLIVPAFDSSYLTIRLSFKEIPNDIY